MRIEQRDPGTALFSDSLLGLVYGAICVKALKATQGYCRALTNLSPQKIKSSYVLRYSISAESSFLSTFDSELINYISNERVIACSFIK